MDFDNVNGAHTLEIEEIDVNWQLRRAQLLNVDWVCKAP